MNQGIGGVATPSMESEIPREMTKLHSRTQELMENASQLANRLIPVLQIQEPKIDSPNKEVEEVMSPLGDHIRKARKTVEQVDHLITALTRHLSI